jgi:hypothetical protein
MTGESRPGRRADDGGGEDSPVPLRRRTRLIRCHSQNVPAGLAAGAAGSSTERLGLLLTDDVELDGSPGHRAEIRPGPR